MDTILVSILDARAKRAVAFGSFTPAAVVDSRKLREPLAVTVRDGPRRVTEIASLIDEGIIRPVVDRVFPFASTKEAMAYVEADAQEGRSSSH